MRCSTLSLHRSTNISVKGSGCSLSSLVGVGPGEAALDVDPSGVPAATDIPAAFSFLIATFASLFFSLEAEKEDMSDLVGLEVLMLRLPGTLAGVGGIELAPGVEEPTNVSANIMSRLFFTPSGFVDAGTARAVWASGLPYNHYIRRQHKVYIKDPKCKANMHTSTEQSEEQLHQAWSSSGEASEGSLQAAQLHPAHSCGAPGTGQGSA